MHAQLYAKTGFSEGSNLEWCFQVTHFSYIPMTEKGVHNYSSLMPEVSDSPDGFCGFLLANLLKGSETKTWEVSKLLIAGMRVHPGERSLCNCYRFYTLSPNICHRSLSETGYSVRDF